jgi:hypothetical protein
MRRSLKTIAWWELRRIPFNFVLITFTFFATFAIGYFGQRFRPPGVSPRSVMLSTFDFFVLSVVCTNLVYTIGWIIELVRSRHDTARAEILRPKVFNAVLIFSLAAVLLPAVIFPLAWSIWGYF